VKLKSFVVLVAAIGLWFLPFALTLASYHAAPGGWMFPRYGLSQYGILILILVTMALPQNSLNVDKTKPLIKPLLFGVFSSLFAVLVCVFVLAAKYMNGILLDRKDGFLPAIKSLGEWVPSVVVHYREIDLTNGWRPYIIQNPYLLLILIALSMLLLVSSLIFSLRRDQEIASK
jgi:hypothetical protein